MYIFYTLIQSHIPFISGLYLIELVGVKLVVTGEFARSLWEKKLGDCIGNNILTATDIFGPHFCASFYSGLRAPVYVSILCIICIHSVFYFFCHTPHHTHTHTPPPSILFLIGVCVFIMYFMYRVLQFLSLFYMWMCN